MDFPSIKDWPAGERPRERLVHVGVERLSDTELLAILLGRGAPGLSAVDLARCSRIVCTCMHFLADL